MRLTFTLLMAVSFGCSKESTTWHSESMKLSEVQSITLVSWAYSLDGGTITLFAETDSGENCMIVLNQHVDSTYPDPGRLFFNDRMIDVRSNDESTIIELLRTSSVDLYKSPTADPESEISEGALIIGDDLQDVLTSSAERNILRFREEIITFVEADEYVRISKHGL